MQRGEVDIYTASWHAWRMHPGVKDGSLIPVIQGGLTRIRELADVPLNAGTGRGRACQAHPGIHLGGFGDRPRA